MVQEHKLYIITHSDLPTGSPSDYLAPQVTHAAMEFAATFPEEWKNWHDTSNSVIILSVPNELKLHEFALKLKEKGIRHVEFREPDIGYELTSLAIVPGPDVKKACSGLPLAGKRVNEGAQERLTKKFDAVDAMVKTEQRSDQNMLQHGESVRDHLFDLLRFMKDPHFTPRFQWRFPQWLLSHSQNLLKSLPPDHILEKYTLWHDCGKPLCRTEGEDGKIHYPDHAKVSANLFRELYPEQEEVAKLIEMDMDLHLLPAENIKEFCEKPQAITLLLTGLAEVHANAALFGGIGTDSFKIKWKHLDKRGKATCRLLFENLPR